MKSPCTYEIVGFTYKRDLDGASEPYIDMTLQKGTETRRLRFLGPRDLRISEGFPCSGGLAILDVSQRQLEGIGVQVVNFESDGGCPEFWARDVVELPSGSEPDGR